MALITLTEQNIAHPQWLALGAHDLPVLDVVQVRELEQACFAQVDSFLMMKAAGLRAAQWLLQHINPHPLRGHSVWVFAGPGNNGGDALIVAWALAQAGLPLQVWEIEPANPRPNSDRAKAAALAAQAGIEALQFTNQPPALPLLATRNTPKRPLLIVDGLLGIGCDKAPNGPMAQAIEQINLLGTSHKATVVSLDCPSGLDCSSGWAPGLAVMAAHTLSFLACKTGLLTNLGKTLSGEVWVDTLGAEIESGARPTARVKSHTSQIQRLPQRGHHHHKGSFGSVAVLGGASGMEGAMVLTTRSALLCGAGRVATCGLGGNQHNGLADPVYPEIMSKSLTQALDFADCIVAGPGLGQSELALNMLSQGLAHQANAKQSWVLDADALNLIAAHPALATTVAHKARAGHHMVLTPHPLEAARLLGTTVENIQHNRLYSASKLAQQFACTVVLKGAGTVVASSTANQASHEIEINTTGGPALATGGTGDVLAGCIAAFLGQGCSAHEAAALGVWLHGASVGAWKGQEELLFSHASEVLQRMKLLLNTLAQTPSSSVFGEQTPSGFGRG